MKPLTKYDWTFEGWAESEDGSAYLVGEADARIRHYQDEALCAEEAAMSHAQRVKELEAERDALRVECDGWARERDEAVAERDAALAILTSGHMQRILRYVANHAGKGLHGTLHDSAEWIEKQIAAIDAARRTE